MGNGGGYNGGGGGYSQGGGGGNYNRGGGGRREGGAGNYDPRGRFALFHNERRRNDKDAHFSGTFTDDAGNEYWVNMWENQPGSKSLFSGTIRPKNQQGNQNAGYRRQGPPPTNNYPDRGGYQGSYADRRGTAPPQNQWGPSAPGGPPQQQWSAPPQNNAPPPNGPEDYSVPFDDSIPF